MYFKTRVTSMLGRNSSV